jgi:hypothetical protein
MPCTVLHMPAVVCVVHDDETSDLFGEDLNYAHAACLQVVLNT